MKNFFLHIIRKIKKGIPVLAWLLLAEPVKAQVDSLPGDPVLMTIYSVQNLHFGTFSGGSGGGTLTLSPMGVRTVTGNVVVITQGVPGSPAIFDVDAVYGALVSLVNGPDITLSGSNGGSMSMRIGDSDPPSPFITIPTQPLRTHVKVGAILTVGSAAENPPGIYTGTFYLTFNLE